VTEEQKKSIGYLWRWTIIAFVAGGMGVAVTYGFVSAMQFLQRLLPTGLLLLPFALGGAFLVSRVLRTIDPDASGEGFPAYRNGIAQHFGVFELRTTLAKLLASFITLVNYGNGGITGPLGRVTSGLTSQLFRKVLSHRGERYEVRLAAICGMAACLGAIFHSSLGAGFFAVEVTGRKKLGYFDLFPAVLASSSAAFLAKAFHLEPFYRFNTPELELGVRHLGLIALVALISAYAGKGFNAFSRFISRKLAAPRAEHPVRTAMGGTAAALLLVMLVNPNLLGTSNDFLASLTNDSVLIYGNIPSAMPLYLVCAVMILVKLFASTLTVASGMSAGFTGPTIIIGMLIGIGVASLFNLPYLSADAYALIAAGFCSMIASTINVPLAAAILGIELFGLHFGFPSAFAAIIGFQINRGSDLYDTSDFDSEA
jgi:CIC family chloride channel protein